MRKQRLRRKSTLSLFIQALLNEEVLVQLRNETTLKGTLDFADHDLK